MSMEQELVNLGFEEAWEKSLEYVYKVPGEYEFRVSVLFGFAWRNEIFPEPVLELNLPHQCDAWEIASGKEAQAEATKFATELDLARAMMSQVSNLLREPVSR